MLLTLIAFPAAMIVAAGTDLWRMTIPNALVVLLAVCFVPYAYALGAPPAALAAHAGAGLFFLVLGILLFALGWMGGGDAKLIAAVALWLGPTPELAQFLLLSAVAGGVLTLAVLLARRCLAPVTGQASLDRLLSPQNGVPYGVALAFAGLTVAPALPGAAQLIASI